MREERQETEALEAVRSVVTDASDLVLNMLKTERGYEDGAAPVTNGVELAYALGQLTAVQRNALLLGAELPDTQRQLVSALIRVLSAKESDDGAQ